MEESKADLLANAELFASAFSQQKTAAKVRGDGNSSRPPPSHPFGIEAVAIELAPADGADRRGGASAGARDDGQRSRERRR